MLHDGDKVQIVKPEPGAYSAVMEGLVGKTVTFSRYGTVPGGDTIHAFCREYEDVPLHPKWLQPAVGSGYYYGYDHRTKQTIILGLNDRKFHQMFTAQERAKAYENVWFHVTREGFKTEFTAHPLPVRKPGPHDHLITASIHDEEKVYKPGEIQFLFTKREPKPFGPIKVDFDINSKMTWDMKLPITGRLKPGMVENTPKDKKPSLKEPEATKAQTDTCNCSSYDLFWRGHTCGRQNRSK